MRNCAILILFLLPVGCSSMLYEPPPVSVAYYHVSPYDTAKESAVKAAQEVGIKIISVDSASGTISGQKGSDSVTIYVTMLQDNLIKIELTLKSPEQRDPFFASDFYRAYEMQMERRQVRSH
jgi:hypothetical protein